VDIQSNGDASEELLRALLTVKYLTPRISSPLSVPGIPPFALAPRSDKGDIFLVMFLPLISSDKLKAFIANIPVRVVRNLEHQTVPDTGRI